jgi:hypothetical protein
METENKISIASEPESTSSSATSVEIKKDQQKDIYPIMTVTFKDTISAA